MSDVAGNEPTQDQDLDNRLFQENLLILNRLPIPDNMKNEEVFKVIASLPQDIFEDIIQEQVAIISNRSNEVVGYQGGLIADYSLHNDVKPARFSNKVTSCILNTLEVIRSAQQQSTDALPILSIFDYELLSKNYHLVADIMSILENPNENKIKVVEFAIIDTIVNKLLKLTPEDKLSVIERARNLGDLLTSIYQATVQLRQLKIEQESLISSFNELTIPTE